VRKRAQNRLFNSPPLAPLISKHSNAAGRVPAAEIAAWREEFIFVGNCRLESCKVALGFHPALIFEAFPQKISIGVEKALFEIGLGDLSSGSGGLVVK